MRNLNTRSAAFLSSFRLRPKIDEKFICCSECFQMCKQDFAKRSKPKVFFAQKLPDLASAEQADATEVCHERA